MKPNKLLALAAIGLLSSGAVQAALFDRGGGLIYDDVLNITWMSDANYRLTQNFPDSGQINQYGAILWADTLSYGGYDDWRLPSALNPDGSGPCLGWNNCSSSELGHMFYNNFGATALDTYLNGTNAANLSLFTNIVGWFYWSDVLDFSHPEPNNWSFNFGDGNQTDGGFFYAFAWAVRDGDVAAVPEPETYAMLLAGLGLLGFAARRRKQKEAALA